MKEEKTAYFGKFDTNADGKLDTTEFAELAKAIDAEEVARLRAEGVTEEELPTKELAQEDIDQMFKDFDADGDAAVVLNEFLEVGMDDEEEGSGDDHEEHDWEETADLGEEERHGHEQFFKDHDKDGDGNMDIEEFKTLYDEDETPDDIGELFGTLDHDNDGKLTFDEFLGHEDPALAHEEEHGNEDFNDEHHDEEHHDEEHHEISEHDVAE